MQFTEAQRDALKARLPQLYALAAEYAANPQKGREAGYAPEQTWIQDPKEVGRPQRGRKGRSEHTAWLYGVARRHLPPGTWRVNEPLNAPPFLTIL